MKTQFYIPTYAERTAFILPSLTLTLCFILWTALKKPVPFLDLIKEIPNYGYLFIALLIIAIILFIYSIGHLLDVVSQIIFERFLADILHGYPHNRLSNFSNSTSRHKELMGKSKTNINNPKFMLTGAKTFVTSISIIYFSQLIVRHSNIENTTIAKIFDFIFYYSLCCLIFSIFLGILKILSMPLHGKYTNIRGSIRTALSAFRKLRNSKKINFIYKISYFLVNVFLFLFLAFFSYFYDILNNSLCELFRINKQLDPSTYQKFLINHKKIIKIDFLKIENNDRFWLVFLHLLTIKNEAITFVLKIRERSHFCRNQSLSCFLSGLLLTNLSNPNLSLAKGLLKPSDISNLAIVAYFLGWIFFWLFLHQNYSYTKNAFRVFSILPESTTKRMPSTSVVP